MGENFSQKEKSDLLKTMSIDGFDNYAERLRLYKETKYSLLLGMEHLGSSEHFRVSGASLHS